MGSMAPTALAIAADMVGIVLHEGCIERQSVAEARLQAFAAKSFTAEAGKT